MCYSIWSVDFLSGSQLKSLSEHKYESQGNTILDPFFQIFWRWFVEQIPRSWPPNSITFVGLLLNIVTALVLVFYSPDAALECPGWALILCGIGLFGYQSLDAIDGKQARRTDSSTPLGELFDHGCDAVSMVFVSISASVCLQLGPYPMVLYTLCFTGMLLFYTAHWRTYCSGVLYFGKFDVTEAQLLQIILYIVLGITGQGVLGYKLPLFDIELRFLPIIASFIVAVLTVIFNMAFICKGGVGKNGSTVAGTSVLSPVLHIATVLLAAFTIFKKSPTNLLQNHPCLYIFSFGAWFAKITIKLVVGHMTKSPLYYWDSVLFGCSLLFLNQYFNCPIPEIIVLWLSLVWGWVDLVYYCLMVCRQISDYLNIYVFSLAPRNRGAYRFGIYKNTRSKTKD